MHEHYTPPVSQEQESTHERDAESLARLLFTDYYQSFRLAQNESAVQPALFEYLAEKHQQAGHQPIMSEALDIAEQKLEDLLPPVRHAATTEAARNDTESGFRAIWNDYRDSLLGEPSPYRSLALILDDMIVQDLRYQEKERPNRSEKQDPHESIVREYILGDRLSGSPQLKEVRDMLKSTLLSAEVNHDTQWMQERLKLLIQSWEANHPDDSFMSVLQDQEVAA